MAMDLLSNMLTELKARLDLQNSSLPSALPAAAVENDNTE